MTKNLLTAVILLISLQALSQETPYKSRSTKEHTLLVGFNAANYIYGEIGYAFNRYGTAGHHPIATAFYGGSEVMIGKDFIIGPKIGWQAMGGLAMGGSMIYYTNFDAGSLVLRPEFGIGMERFKMVYGWNVKITNKDFERINTHLFSFSYLITLKTIKQ